jgi:hypothetical protein
MKEALFEELLKSVKQGGQILRGEKKLRENSNFLSQMFEKSERNMG